MAELTSVVDASMGFIVPVPKPLMADWLREWFTDRRGVPFQESQVPWVTAPNGPCDAIDTPRINEIWLQWAARLFKTTLGQSMQAREAQFAPKLQMFATRNENLCKQVLSRFYESLEEHRYFRSRIPNPKVRNATNINFGKCRLNGTWAGSKSGLADESIQYGHANEVDKWEYPTTSEEGDPLPRFLKRGGEYPDRKFLIESTPAMHGTSRVEAGRLGGSDCRYWVPCPHCARFQEILLGNGQEPPGIFWEKGPDGHSNPELAEKTAYYICAYCKAVIEDEHRYDMVNAGVWVPMGCTVDDDAAHEARQTSSPDHYPWLRGTPIRDGRIYSSQMSVFHALFHGWGDIAGDYIRKRKREADRRQWITEEAGETWKPKQRKAKATWEELCGRMLRPGVARGVIPRGYSTVTIQFDRQDDENPDGTLPYLVTAWDPDRRCHIVDYDYLVGVEDATTLVLRKWDHEDGGRYLMAVRVALDSGFEPAKQSMFAKALRRKGVRVQLIKGSSTPLDTLYKENKLDKKSATPGEVLMRMDTLRSQMWVEELLFRTDQSEAEGLSVYDAELEEHQDLCLQLLNEDTDEKGRWNRIHDEVPNDYRDCLRYAKGNIEKHTRGRAPKRRISTKQEKAATEKRQKQQKQRQPRANAVKYLERPGGWI